MDKQLLKYKYDKQIKKMERSAIKSITLPKSKDKQFSPQDEAKENEKITLFIERYLQGEFEEFEKVLIANDNLSEEEAHEFSEEIRISINQSVTIKAIQYYRNQFKVVKYIVPAVGIIILLVMIILVVYFVLNKPVA